MLFSELLFVILSYVWYDFYLYLLKTTTALVYDAVTLFARALDDFERTQQSIFMSPIDCESRDPWPYGTSLINFMKTVIT